MTVREPQSTFNYPGNVLPTWTTVGTSATAALGDGEPGWYYFEAASGVINIVWSEDGGTAATTTSGLHVDASGGETHVARYIYLRSGEKFTAIADAVSRTLVWANTGER